MLATHSTRELFVHSDKSFTVTASDLTGGGRRPLFCQIFGDSCDEGMVLVSHRTGKEVRMVVSRTVHDAEGDIMKWCLQSVTEDERKLRLSAPIKLTVWND